MSFLYTLIQPFLNADKLWVEVIRLVPVGAREVCDEDEQWSEVERLNDFPLHLFLGTSASSVALVTLILGLTSEEASDVKDKHEVPEDPWHEELDRERPPDFEHRDPDRIVSDAMREIDSLFEHIHSSIAHELGEVRFPRELVIAAVHVEFEDHNEEGEPPRVLITGK